MNAIEKDKPKAAEAIRQLADKHGQITPEIVLDAARPKDSPLHRFFCWDNTAAARNYRLIQAACLIRRVKVTYTGANEETVRIRAFVNVMPDRDTPADEDAERDTRGVYVPVQSALTVDSYRDQVIRQCKADIESFRRKYSALQEAAQIIAAMEGFAETVTID